ncbi:N-acetylglucosamine-6-phosphate deacetylase [Bacillus sp. 31A1R]|uniref:N-acetylglucosamine-6-phosphate deacetylase n=1 Tax=Robertmurraya mangrovi TaxID=3098077 RepID=A0ABU5J3W6_9BACI|nr:N-acetylglucosamine-6-phosphate deacetylase [Bacillus sp. 31A1R]MDZ5474126.1 N-acetylglucosamine-6-phosphate deacetylase [Bacillus sp. 31A1R]
MSGILIKNGIIVLEDTILDSGFVYIEEGRIKNVGPMTELQAADYSIETIDLKDEKRIIPGFIDVHIHGVGGADTMDGTIEALSTMATCLPAEGTTSFLATTITQEVEKIEKAMRNVAEYNQKDNIAGKAEILGIHLEGPFINTKQAGAQPRAQIIPPNVELFKGWQTVADNLIKLVTLAPEEENGIELIQYLAETGVIPSIGHSDANYDEVKAAVDAGAIHVTHLFNGMRGMHHREPGVAGAALLFKELMVEMIADGIHIRPEMIKLALQAKGIEKSLLVTDSMRAKCLKNGQYDLGGHNVFVENGKALLQDGTLAGSILKMQDAVKNIMNFTEISLLEAIQLASVNPAKQLNVFDRKGSIAIGKDADIVILDEHFEVEMTFCRGIKAFER